MAIATTYTPIATQTLGSAASTFTFSSIPQTYTDLLVVSNANTTNGSDSEIHYVINSDSGNHYSKTFMYGNGSSVITFRDSTLSGGENGGLAVAGSYFATASFHFMNYSNTTTYKIMLLQSAAGTNSAAIGAYLWRGSTGSSTEAITRLDFTVAGGGNFNTGTSFTLYGILAA